MKKFLVILIISLISQLSQENERFIPLELFTGGEIRDDTEIKFTKANLVFGEKKRKKIVGPEDWKNPNTGEIIKVYKRTRKSQSGVKTQLFTVTNNGQSSWTINGTDRNGNVSGNNPTLNFQDGDVAQFAVTTDDNHPFLIKTASSTGTGDQLQEKTINNVWPMSG